MGATRGLIETLSTLIVEIKIFDFRIAEAPQFSLKNHPSHRQAKKQAGLIAIFASECCQ